MILPDEDMMSWSSVEIHGPIVKRLWWNLSNVTRCSLIMLVSVLMVRLVLGGKVETHTNILVITKWSLFCHVVEDDHWSRHLNFFLLLNHFKFFLNV